MILIKFAYGEYTFNAVVPLADVTTEISKSFDVIDTYHQTKICGPAMMVSIRRIEEFALRYMRDEIPHPDIVITRIVCVPFATR